MSVTDLIHGRDSILTLTFFFFFYLVDSAHSDPTATTYFAAGQPMSEKATGRGL